MEKSDRMKLQKNYENLLEVMYSCVSPYLISKFVLDANMHAEIESCKTERKKMEKLLEILPTRGSKAMDHFIAALKPNYYWLSAKLLNDDLEDSSQVSHSGCITESESECNDLSATSVLDNSIETYVLDVGKIMQSSCNLCNNLMVLGRRMCLKQSTLADIRRSMLIEGSTDSAIYSLLDQWIAKVGPSKASFRQLLKILKAEEMNDVCEAVENFCRSQAQSTQKNNI